MIEKGFQKGLVESLSQASGLEIAKANLLLFSSEIQSAKNTIGDGGSTAL